MAFIPVNNGRGHRWAPTPRVRIFVGASSTPHACVVHLTRLVVEQLGWSAGDRLQVEIGDGADFGRLRIVQIKGRIGRKLSTTNSQNHFVTGFSIPHFVGAHSREDIIAAWPKSASCAFEAKDGQLFVTIPLSTEQSRPKPRAVA